jgi:NhaP-type Na+/H+ or K+/H+ antiporter
MPNRVCGTGTEVLMRAVTRTILFALLIAGSLVSTHTAQLRAQAESESEQEAPETFVPSEKLPADSAISFPVDI